LERGSFGGDVDAVGDLADFECDVDAARNVGVELVAGSRVLLEPIGSYGYGIRTGGNVGYGVDTAFIRGGVA
jgi:hypothetical protein